MTQRWTIKNFYAEIEEEKVKKKINIEIIEISHARINHFQSIISIKTTYAIKSWLDKNWLFR